MTEASPPNRPNDLAVIGWSLRLPGADSPEGLWQNLVSKRATVSFFSEEEVIAEGVEASVARDPNFVRARAILPDIDLFDAEFFGYSPREAEMMDPQQRLFLECAWQALEDAGYVPGPEAGRVGVFGSSSMSSYLFANVAARHGGDDPFQALLGNDRNHLATRVAFKLDLKGPAVNIQTACSASLVAFHYGCQALLNGECDMALVGGASITVPQKTGHRFQIDGIYSPDGCCRAFDEKAHGIVGGNGVAVVVVKRLAEALAEGDMIHAVVLGSAVNNDGARKLGYTASGVEGQAEVVSEALSVADVEPDSIGYVEAHGTGTLIGDPIEIAALTRVYRARTERRCYCGIGSVKSNIGHLDAAAGLVGLIKTILALKHQEIPPTLHVNRPNPTIDFDASPFYVATDRAPWPRGTTPRRAGVSAFGLGGTNAHVVLEEPPERSPLRETARSELLVLSAKKPESLRRASIELAQHLAGDCEAALSDVAFTLQVGRRAFADRCFTVAASKLDAASALSQNRVRTAAHPVRGKPAVAFLFPGLGEQFAGMGLGLYRTEPVYRAAIDECLGHLAAHFDADLRRMLFATDPDEPPSVAGSAGTDLRAMLRRGEAVPVADKPPTGVELLHPLLFSTEYALARLFQSWGVEPSALLGYSLGEYTAACLAGVFSLHDALFVVRRRAALIATLPQGAAISVQIDEAKLREILPESAAIAGVNAVDLFTVAGTVEAVAALEARLAREGIAVQGFGASHAFHTPVMDAVAAALEAVLEQVDMRPAERPILSNVSGSWADPDVIATPSYWLSHLCRPVCFAAALQTLRATGDPILLELGPGRSLGALAHRTAASEGLAACRTVAALGHRYEHRDDRDQALTALGALWLEGVEPDWGALHRGRRRGRVPLPTYAFDRKRYWIDPPKSAANRGTAAPSVPERSEDLADWFYVPSWSRALRPATPSGPTFAGCRRWLVFGGNLLADAAVVELLRQGCAVECVAMANPVQPGGWLCRPDRPEDYAAVLRELRQRDRFPDAILHLWSAADAPIAASGAAFDAALLRGAGSLLFLAKALADVEPRALVSVWVGTVGGQDVESRDMPRPEQAAVAAARLVVPQEHRNQRWHVVDGVPGNAQFARDLVAELAAGTTETLVAYRNGIRWVPTHQQLRLPAPAQDALRVGGRYLVLGGLGRIGLSLVDLLGRRYRARLVVAGDIAIDGASVDLDSLNEDARRKAEVLRGVVDAGGSLRLIEADLGDMDRVVAETLRLMHRIDGVVYAPGKAGLAGVAPVAQLDRRLIEWHTAAKVHPLYALAPALEAAQPSFVLLASSLSSVLGGLGLAAHATAHVAMDAFARRMHRAGAPWIAVNWNWADWGDSRAAAAATEAWGAGRTVKQFEITDAEAGETFRRALSVPETPQLVVSSGVLEARIAQWSASPPAPKHFCETGPEPKPGPSTPHTRRNASGYARPDLTTAFVPAEGSVASKVAAIWCEALGLNEIGADDNFFELGGHSLLGVQVVTQLRETFGVNVSLRTIFATPTVAAVAASIEALMPEAQNADGQATGVRAPGSSTGVQLADAQHPK